MGRRRIVIVCAVLWALSAMAVSPTGKLPVVYVNTNGQGIYDTETQVPAKVYIDPKSSGYDALGTSSAPLEATIKGRGNWTWSGFDKKPYKLKFAEKTKVLGMHKNRHWCLMACADDYLGFLKMPTGFMLSEALGLRWTPHTVPVELVLNGQYQGLYFLTEQVRIAGHRVDIHEQADNETHADSITGGWLVEIDNYPSEGNVVLQEPDQVEALMISLKEPESLSSRQRTYLEQQMNGLNNALYGSSSSQLERLLDIDEAAKYYIVQEVMEDCESYHGSCFLYKDRDSLGVADKWKFGPVWDFGNAYDRYKFNYMEAFIYVEPSFTQHWIGQLAQWPVFQQKVMENWYVFYHDHMSEVREQVGLFAGKLTEAAKKDAELWGNSSNYCLGQGDNANMSEKLEKLYRRYDWRVEWLYSQWGEGTRPATYDIENAAVPTRAEKKLENGQVVILLNGRTYNLQGQRIK